MAPFVWLTDWMMAPVAGMLKMPFIESTKICEINADNFQDENTLVDEVMSSLNKMLSQKEVSIV